MPDVKRAQVKKRGFKPGKLPHNLKPDVFAIAMDDIYEMLGNVNEALIGRGLLRDRDGGRDRVALRRS
jgi:hypothetical protein